MRKFSIILTAASMLSIAAPSFAYESANLHSKSTFMNAKDAKKKTTPVTKADTKNPGNKHVVAKKSKAK